MPLHILYDPTKLNFVRDSSVTTEASPPAYLRPAPCCRRCLSGSMVYVYS